MSQEQLAEKANISRSHLSAIEAPGMVRAFSMEAFFNIADTLDIDPAELISASLFPNPKLKYFYCHNNRITELDTRANPLLRHLNATENPLKAIRSLAPRRGEELPLELYAGEGGCVGLKFNPVYNAQWKETGEWQQSYYAYPDEGYRFAGWYENGAKISVEEAWIDEYGTGRILTARFEKDSAPAL